MAVTNPLVRTVSDAKRDFYAHHTRPINSIYRRVVDELLVEMHLLSVNADFAYDPVYALGIVTTYDRFMQGYSPESDQGSIFEALCRAVGGNPDQYRQDATALTASLAGVSVDTLKAQLADPATAAATEGYGATLAAIAGQERFKYSRAFGIGLYTLVETVDAAALGEDDAIDAWFKGFTTARSISFDKLQKDLELYRSNLEKFAQAQEVMQDMLAADRKKREERQKAAEAKQAAAESPVAATAESPAEPPAADSGE